APGPRSDWPTAMHECRRLPNWSVPRRRRHWPGAQPIGDRIVAVGGIAPGGNVRRKRVRNFAAAFGQRKQHYAAVGGQPASIKRGCDFLARNRWQAKAELAIVGHGGCGQRSGRAKGWSSTPIPYAGSTLCAI